jgi:YVTN family beta-propeller protein
MKSYLCALSCLTILVAMVLVGAPITTRIYVLNRDSSTIDVIDSATNKVMQTIQGISEPQAAVFSPDGSRAYITSESSDRSLNVVDTKTGNIIKKVLLSGRANHPAITNDGKRILVCINDPGKAVDIVDTTSLELVKVLPMKAPMHECLTTPDGEYVVAGSTEGKFIDVIDLRTEQSAWEVEFDGGVLTFEIEGAGVGLTSTSRIFVQLTGFNGFSVVDFAARREVSRIQFPDKAGSLTAGRQPTHGTAISPDGKTIWFCGSAANSVFVYSLPGLKLLGQVAMPEIAATSGHPAVGGHPFWITFVPDGKTVYVSNADAKMVSVIDVATLKEIARIPVGEQPRFIAALPVP